MFLIAGLVIGKFLLAQEQAVSERVLAGPASALAEGLENVRSIRELDDGRLIVVSSRRRVPLLADFRTRELTEISREGDGPREFRQPTGLVALPGDSSLIVDGSRWIVLHGAIPITSLRAWRARAFDASLSGADRLGRVLEIRQSKLGAQKDARVFDVPVNAESLVAILHRRAPVHAGAATQLQADTLTQLRGAFRGVRNHQRSMGKGMPVTYQLNQELAGQEQAVLFLDGWIAVARAEPYRVDWYPPDGPRLAGSPLPYSAVPVDDAQKGALIARSWPNSKGIFQADDYPPWPKVLPPFLNDALLPMPDGRVAIRRTIDALRAETVYDFVDRRGQLSGRLSLKVNERLAGFGRAHVYVVRRDEDDLQWIERYQWPQPNSAQPKEALARVK